MRKRIQLAQQEPQHDRPPTEPDCDAEPDDDVYDDEQDHERCHDCKGTGYYIGFTERRYCPTCEGSGFL